MLRYVLLTGALALIPLSAGAEWWQDRGCELTQNPDIVYCPPSDDADMSKPAINDFQPRQHTPMFQLGVRIRNGYLEEMITREDLEALRNN